MFQDLQLVLSSIVHDGNFPCFEELKNTTSHNCGIFSCLFVFVTKDATIVSSFFSNKLHIYLLTWRTNTTVIFGEAVAIKSIIKDNGKNQNCQQS